MKCYGNDFDRLAKCSMCEYRKECSDSYEIERNSYIERFRNIAFDDDLLSSLPYHEEATSLPIGTLLDTLMRYQKAWDLLKNATPKQRNVLLKIAFGEKLENKEHVMKSNYFKQL